MLSESGTSGAEECGGILLVLALSLSLLLQQRYWCYCYCCYLMKQEVDSFFESMLIMEIDFVSLRKTLLYLNKIKQKYIFFYVSGVKKKKNHFFQK